MWGNGKHESTTTHNFSPSFCSHLKSFTMWGAGCFRGGNLVPSTASAHKTTSAPPSDEWMLVCNLIRLGSGSGPHILNERSSTAAADLVSRGTRGGNWCEIKQKVLTLIYQGGWRGNAILRGNHGFKPDFYLFIILSTSRDDKIHT